MIGNDLIERLRYEADISARPGQMDRLHALADEFAAIDAALEAARAERDALEVANELLMKALRELGGREQRDKALLRQALEALEYYRSGEDYQPTPASEAIAAIEVAWRSQHENPL